MTAVNILAFSGSTRTNSYNKALIKIAAQGARQAGANVTLVDLRDFPMPLYDGDLEAESGLPQKARELKKLLLENDALLIASPEYNSSISAVLKNSIDWISRGDGAKGDLSGFQGKTAALLSASIGGLGGLRGLVHLRAILGNIGVIVLPEQFTQPAASEAFDERGEFRDAARKAAAEKIGARLAEVAARLKG